MLIFCLSLIPLWSDGFENEHPIIINNQEAQNNNNNENNNNENLNNENNNNENDIGTNTNDIRENNLNNIANNNKINPEEINNNYNKPKEISLDNENNNFNENENFSNENIVFKKINLKEAENDNQEYVTLEGSNSEKNLNNKIAQNLKSESEPISVSEPITKRIKVNEDTGNKNENENEYIFPENLNLDNLSCNDAFIENNKKKNNE